MIQETLKKENDIYFLQRNGKNMVCPFSSPVVIPIMNKFQQQPQMAIQSRACSSECPHFFVEPDGLDQSGTKASRVVLGCGEASFNKLTVEEEKPTDGTILR